MPGLALQPIELATLLPSYPGPQLVAGQGVEETWKAEVYAESGPTIAYVKMLEPQQLISEVVCALIGAALGLNMPKPFLVHVDRANLSQSRKWQTDEQLRICFGSEDQKHPSLRRYLIGPSSLPAPVVNALLNWASYKHTAWFDEWTANMDRHIGNILYDGSEFWLIDHSHALTGPKWVPADLIPEKQVDNRFLNPTYVSKMSSSDKDKWKDMAGVESLRYQSVALDSLEESGMLADYSSLEQRTAVVHFLAKRAENFVHLACDRLGIPRPLI